MIYPFVSIIFPTFNGWQDTKECLASIDRLTYPTDKIEIIIVDNTSTDETVKNIKSLILNGWRARGTPIERPHPGVRRGRTSDGGEARQDPLQPKNRWWATSAPIRHPPIRLIVNHKNLGFSKAINLGIRKSKGEYLLITNNDVVFDKNYLTQLVDFLQKNPLVGITGGKVYYRKPKGRIAFAGAEFDFYTGILKPNPDPQKIFKTDWISGCDLLVKREVIAKIGAFDEKFFFYFEDLDLCLRAKRAGYKVVYYPKAIIHHGEGVSIDRQGWQKKSEYYYQGKARVIFKHGTKLQIFTSLLFQFLIGLPYQVLVLKHQNYPPAIAALVQNLKDFVFGSPGEIRHQNQVIFQPKWKRREKIISENELPLITVIFPTLNGRHLVPKILSSIKNQNYPSKKIEVIIVDNASTDGTPNLISKDFPWVSLIRLSHNTGSAPPITMGAKMAKGDYILATNDDVVLDKNCLIELMKLMLSDGRIGIATGKMLDVNPPHKPLFFGFRINLYFGYYTFDFENSNKIRECDWAPGSCILINKQLFEKVGYFDNQYIFCGDDHDLCFQVRSFGYKIMYTPKAFYYHAFTRAQRQGKTSQENLFAHYRGKIRFMIKNANLLQILTFSPTQIVIGPFYSYFKFGHKTFFPLLKALVWNISHLKETIKARQKARMRRSYYQ